MKQQDAPSLPATAVARPRMVERLDAAARGKLTMVVAPAGFGKSVLVTQWARVHPGRVAWVVVRREDDAKTIASTLGSALGALGTDVASTTGPQASLRDESFGDAFVAGTAALPDSYVVIEGGDRLDGDLAAALGSLVERASPRFHVVATTRSSGSFAASVDRLGVSDEVAFLRSGDLAFDREDGRDLLQTVSGHLVSNGDVDTLVARTEGWAVALQFAAMAMRDAGKDASAVVARFGGDDTRLAAYCRTEMLERQPAAIRRVLVRTSVVGRLSGGLCDALTGAVDGVETLGALARESLIDRVGDQWFRYHPLWCDVLVRELRASEPGAEERLLLKAADWHLTRDDIDAAARCLIGARDWDGLIALVSSRARPMFERTRARTLVDWLDAVPAAHRRGDHVSVLERAVLLNMAGRTRAAEHVMRDLGEPSSLPAQERVVVDVLRATWVEHHYSPEKAIEAADNVIRVVDDLPDGALPDIAGLTTRESLRTIANASRARAKWQLGDVRPARAALRAELAAGDTYPPWRHSVLGALALVEATTGRLTIAEQHARHALRVAAEMNLSEHPSMIDANLAMGHVQRERNELETATALLEQAHHFASEAHRSTALALVAAEQAHLELALGRPELGLEHLRRFRAGGHGIRPPFIEGRLRSIEARLLIELRRTDQAEAALMYEDGTTAEMAGVIAQLAVARHDVAAAKSVLHEWPDASEFQCALLCRLWGAVVTDAEGDRTSALAQLERVVSEAEPEGHVGVFLDVGADAQRLLRALFRAQPTAYLKTLVRPERPVPLATKYVSAVPLSARELLVLRFLPSRLTNAEIGEELFVSLNTVKTYVKSIYTKLGVNARREAIERAEELGIV